MMKSISISWSTDDEGDVDFEEYDDEGNIDLVEQSAVAQQQDTIVLQPGITIRANRSTSPPDDPHYALFSGGLCRTSQGEWLFLTVAHLFPAEGVHCYTKDGEDIGVCVYKNDEYDLSLVKTINDGRIDIQNDVVINGIQFQPIIGEPASTRVLVQRKDDRAWYRGCIIKSQVNDNTLTYNGRRLKLVNMMHISCKTDDGRWVAVTSVGDSGGLVVQDPFEYDSEGLPSLESDDRRLLVYGIVSAIDADGEYTVCNTLLDIIEEIEETRPEVFEGTSRSLGIVIRDGGLYPTNSLDCDLPKVERLVFAGETRMSV
jgi:hypothetical protein